MNSPHKQALKATAPDMVHSKPKNHIEFLDLCLPLPSLRGFPVNVHTIYFLLLFEEQQSWQHANLEEETKQRWLLSSLKISASIKQMSKKGFAPAHHHFLFHFSKASTKI